MDVLYVGIQIMAGFLYVASEIRPLPDLPSTFYGEEGDIMLGMVIPLHRSAIYTTSAIVLLQIH